MTLYAGHDSAWGGDLVIHDDETTRAKTLELSLDTVYIDCSHYHELSKHQPDHQIVNWILDGECQWHPPNALVTTPYDQKFYPSEIMTMGIDIDAIPFVKKPRADYLVFSAKIHPNKGVSDGVKVHQGQSVPVKFVGERFIDIALPDWRDTLTGKAFYKFVGNALGLINPIVAKRQLGGGLMPLEAAAMGCPVLTYDFMSSRYHVAHGVSGFIVRDVDEMIDAVQDLALIDRKKCREWVAETHSLEKMAVHMESYIEKTFKKVGV